MGISQISHFNNDIYFVFVSAILVKTSYYFFSCSSRNVHSLPISLSPAPPLCLFSLSLSLSLSLFFSLYLSLPSLLSLSVYLSNSVCFLQSTTYVAVSMSHLLKLYIYGVYINNVLYSMLTMTTAYLSCL